MERETIVLYVTALLTVALDTRCIVDDVQW